MIKRISLFLPLLLLFTSCSLFYEETTRVSRGSLSEAMGKSSDDYEGERKVEDSHQYTYPSYYDDNDDEDYGKSKYSWEEERYLRKKRRREEKFRKERMERLDYFDSIPLTKKNSDVLEDEIIKEKKFFNVDTSIATGQDSVMEKFIDSTGKVDLKKYRGKLSQPFTIDESVNVTSLGGSPHSEGKIIKTIRLSDDNPEKNITTENIQSESINKVPYKNGEDKKEFYIGVQMLTGLKYSSKYSNVTGGSIVLAFYYDEKRRAAFNFGAAYLPSREDSDLLGSIDDLWQLHLGYEQRFYITSEKSFVGAYVPIEANIRALFWKYRNPIISDLYDEEGVFLGEEEISGDGLWGLSLGSGFGVSLIQTNPFKLSTTATFGGALNWVETHEGFDNDVFVGDLYLKVSLEVLFGIK